jgi:hypothetical protein
VRAFVVAILLLGCRDKGTAEQPAGSAGSAASVGSGASATTAAAPGSARLALDHATLLEPEDVIAARVTDQRAWTQATKQAVDAVLSYDAAHPAALPPDLDLFIAMRSTGTRAWLVGPAGDVEVPELDTQIAKLPIVVKEGTVAVAATFARPGAHSAGRSLYMPAAWKAGAGSGSGGIPIDDAIGAAWPR